MHVLFYSLLDKAVIMLYFYMFSRTVISKTKPQLLDSRVKPIPRQRGVQIESKSIKPSKKVPKKSTLGKYPSGPY